MNEHAHAGRYHFRRDFYVERYGGKCGSCLNRAVECFRLRRGHPVEERECMFISGSCTQKIQPNWHLKFDNANFKKLTVCCGSNVQFSK